MDIQAGAHGFGDGSHPTTLGMLAALEGIGPDAFAPRIACDMGAGSGILSLAMATQFRCPVLAVDLDPRAVETLAENAARNGMAGRIRALRADGFDHPQIQASAPFDLIAMNILAEPLLRLANDAVAHLAPDGLLLMAGLMRWQEAPIRESYQGLGLELSTRLTIGDWITLAWQRPRS